jgi:hypothetical protein
MPFDANGVCSGSRFVKYLKRGPTGYRPHDAIFAATAEACSGSLDCEPWGSLRLVTMQITVLCDVMACSLLDRYQRFAGTCCLRLLPWSGRQRVPPKRRYPSIKVDDVTCLSPDVALPSSVTAWSRRRSVSRARILPARSRRPVQEVALGRSRVEALVSPNTLFFLVSHITTLLVFKFHFDYC